MRKKLYLPKIITFMIVLPVFFGLFLHTGISPAFAQNETKRVQVEKIEPVYVEKGKTTYLVTLRAHVTNNGESETVTVDVKGTDDKDHTLANVRFSGSIPEGLTRVLMEQFQIRGEDYENITSWTVKQ
ncbi:MAG: hypothetical protein K9K81_07250 [Desulfobacteraceae bacterium]|jgi:hypothetical protein|nr:hypothetical protein [Desulfobacteraceae bacterium]